jgi:hypothetical protein
MCDGQRNFVTVLVRLNTKIRGHQGTQRHGLLLHCRREAISPLALSHFQPDEVPRRLVGMRQGPSGGSGSRHLSTEQQQLTWPPLPDQVKRGGRRTSACSTMFVYYPQAAITTDAVCFFLGLCCSVVLAGPNPQGAVLEVD